MEPVAFAQAGHERIGGFSARVACRHDEFSTLAEGFNCGEHLQSMYPRPMGQVKARPRAGRQAERLERSAAMTKAWSPRYGTLDELA